MLQKTIQEIVRDQESAYTSGTPTTISKYVDFNQYENINRIDAYLNSKHTSGDSDALGREKPFFNIVTAAVNIWYRATKVKKEFIKIRSDKNSNILSAFIATIHLQDWMKREAFGSFLNDWGLNLARYGSTVLKFVEKDGYLHCCVVPWNRLITDTVDFDNNVKIEKLYLTPSQLLKNKSYDKKIVDELLTALQSRENLNGHKKDTRDEYIELYEVHGELPLSLLTGKESDEDEYVQQMHVVSFVKGKGKGEFDDFTLVSGREKKDPYMITHLIKEDGRTQSIGAVEHLFEAQWMMNHTTKAIKDQLDLSSKLIFQTSDTNFVGRNATDAIETGDILIHEPNQPLTQLANSSHDITSLQNFGNQWKVLAQEISATPDAIRGNTQPSGTAYRLQQLITTEAHSLFEEMRDNKDLHIEEMMRKYILPYIKKKMDTVKEIGATLNAHQIKQIDSAFVPKEAVKRVNKRVKETFLNGGTVTQEQQAAQLQSEMGAIQQGLNQLGNKRFIAPDELNEKSWKEAIDDFEWEAEVDTPSDQEHLDLAMTTLNSLFQTIANPATAQVMNTPKGKFLFNKIMQISGTVSPVEMADLDTPEPTQPAQPVPSPIQPQQVQPINGG